MKKFILFLFISMFSFSIKCFIPTYEFEDGKIYIMNGPSKKTLVGKADFDTFQILGKTLARDKNNIYYDGEVLEEIDYKTFEFISVRYPKIDPVWGTTCQEPVIKFKDKNGEYSR